MEAAGDRGEGRNGTSTGKNTTFGRSSPLTCLSFTHTPIAQTLIQAYTKQLAQQNL